MGKLCVIEEELEKEEEEDCAINWLLPEDIEGGFNKKRVFINEDILDVKYFHKEAPVKQISECNVSEDSSVITLPRKPLYITIIHGIRNIFRKRYGNKTLLQWAGKCCIWMVFLSGGAFLVGLVIYVFAMFAM